MAGAETLPITWQRPVKERETCPGCRSTERNVLSAIAMLKVAVHPLG